MVIEIVIDSHYETDFSNDIFITGFHGLGWTGYIAIRHIVKSMNAERIGYIQSDKLPDIISIEGGRLILPYQFHQFNQTIIFQPSYQPLLIDPYKMTEQQKVIKTLADWIVKSQFKEAILIGGLDKQFQQDSQQLRILPTHTFPKAEKLNIPFLEKGLLVRGPLALLLAHLEMKNFPALVLLPYANVDRPDPAAAAVAIDFLNEFYSLNISTSQLQDDALKIENEISEILKQERERAAREPRDMYI
ncbi:MAG: proteasome assembly chaperone family protein [Candidatus Helarchaeota archaeon]